MLILSLLLPAAMALGPKAEIDEYVDNRDGSATLHITCANGRKVRFTTDKKRIHMLDLDGVIAILAKECKLNEPGQ